MLMSATGLIESVVIAVEGAEDRWQSSSFSLLAANPNHN